MIIFVKKYLNDAECELFLFLFIVGVMSCSIILQPR